MLHAEDLKKPTLLTKISSLVLLSAALLVVGFIVGKNFGIKSKSNQFDSLQKEFEEYKLASEPDLLSCNDSLFTCTQNLKHTKELTNALLGRLHYSSEPELEELDTFPETFSVASYKISSELLENRDYETTEYAYLNHTIYKRVANTVSDVHITIWELSHLNENISESEMLSDFVYLDSGTNKTQYVSDLLIDSQERYITVNGLEFYFYGKAEQEIKMYTYQRNLVTGTAILVEITKKVDEDTNKTINELKELANTFVQQ